MENWKDIIGFEGLYQISDMGRVRSIKFGKVKIRKTGKNIFNYLFVDLYKNNIGKNYLIHRLVAIHFLDNPENKSQVNHINGIKDDNRLINLEWNTPSENMKHAYDNGLKSRGSQHTNSKLTEQQVLEIRQSNLSQRKLGRIYGVSGTHIGRIKRAEKWTHI